MKFEYATFSVVARGAFYKEYENFCTCGDVEPAPDLECAFGMTGLAFIKILKESIFKNGTNTRELSVSEFDNLCGEAFEKATEDMDNIMVRIGMLGFLANITVEIKRYYGMVNDKEEE